LRSASDGTRAGSRLPVPGELALRAIRTVASAQHFPPLRPAAG
jgi:hypothetical protein